jgi:hypothetical protein
MNIQKPPWMHMQRETDVKVLYEFYTYLVQSNDQLASPHS